MMNTVILTGAVAAKAEACLSRSWEFLALVFITQRALVLTISVGEGAHNHGKHGSEGEGGDKVRLVVVLCC